MKESLTSQIVSWKVTELHSEKDINGSFGIRPGRISEPAISHLGPSCKADCGAWMLRQSNMTQQAYALQ
jgi:hypothetical protein